MSSSMMIIGASWSHCPVKCAIRIKRITIVIARGMRAAVWAGRMKTLFILIVRHLHQTVMPFSGDKKSNQWAREDNSQTNNHRYFAWNKIDKTPSNGENRHHWKAISKHGDINPISNSATFGCITNLFFLFLRTAGLRSTFHLVTSCMDHWTTCSIRKRIFYSIYHEPFNGQKSVGGGHE